METLIGGIAALSFEELPPEDDCRALSGPVGESLISLMFSNYFRQPLSKQEWAAVECAHELGWLDDLSSVRPKFTQRGWRVAQALCQYVLWRRRDRRMHSETRLEALCRERFRQRRVLEIGCGAAVNLFSIQNCAALAAGIDIEPEFLRFGRYFAQREGEPCPLLVHGWGEALPWGENSFDYILGFGAMQFMRIDAAYREAARVLAPGGQLINIMSSLGQFTWHVVVQTVRTHRVREFARELRTIGDTLLYRVPDESVPLALQRKGTARPVYPDRRAMIATIRDAGLTCDAALTIDHETCYIASKGVP